MIAVTLCHGGAALALAAMASSWVSGILVIIMGCTSLIGPRGADGGVAPDQRVEDQLRFRVAHEAENHQLGLIENRVPEGAGGSEEELPFLRDCRITFKAAVGGVAHRRARAWGVQLVRRDKVWYGIHASFFRGKEWSGGRWVVLTRLWTHRLC